MQLSFIRAALQALPESGCPFQAIRGGSTRQGALDVPIRDMDFKVRLGWTALRSTQCSSSDDSPPGRDERVMPS